MGNTHVLIGKFYYGLLYYYGNWKLLNILNRIKWLFETVENLHYTFFKFGWFRAVIICNGNKILLFSFCIINNSIKLLYIYGLVDSMIWSIVLS